MFLNQHGRSWQCKTSRRKALWFWAFVSVLTGFEVHSTLFAQTTTSVEAPFARVDFARQVWPIFSKSCLGCHGGENQESGFRLDSRAAALTTGDEHAPNIVPGAGATSHLVQFVSGQVDGMQMPPDGERLPAEQIELLRRWIDEGAEWADVAEAEKAASLDWWSLKPLSSPPVPARTSGGRNEIDDFVRAKLASKGISPSPEADRRTLIRRVYFDLIGLPPTPEEVQDFVSSTENEAYEKMIRELLASPRYGERWARHWMDTAHFAETHGHDQDRIRENAWPYRDYLIESLNSDKPFSRFVQEQIAGDVLFPDEPATARALGFLAAGPWDESTLRDIREDTIDRQIGRYLDRDDIITNVTNNFLSSTAQCARCHNHKFDPISQADYYALQAVFSGVERANRAYDADPAVHEKRSSLRDRKRLLESASPELRELLLSPAIQTDVAAWERELGASRAAWKILEARTAVSAGGATLTQQEDSSVLASGINPEQDTYTLVFSPPAGECRALRLEALTDPSLPKQGPGRQDNGNLHLSEMEVFAGGVDGTRIELGRASADFEQVDWGIARAIDGNPQTAWGIFPQVGQPHVAVFELKQPLAFVAGDSLSIVVKQLHGGRHLIGRIRISISSSPGELAAPLPEQIERIVTKPAAERTPDELFELAHYQQRSQVESELAKLPPPSLIYAVASDFEPDGSLKPPPGPRPVHVLKRGDIHQPLEEATPGSLSCLTGIDSRFSIPREAQEGARRAALARWMTERDNVLVWRSIVNRVWHWHFGRGIVATPNDFGRMGSLPTHPELLDWLAEWFRDQGQSLKELHYLIVTSATYRQSSAARPEDDPATDADSDNHYLWRMNRNRLDAECIRDSILAVSGQLDLRMGGPSDRQFGLTPGSHVTPIIDYSNFDLDGPLGTRRSVYRFLFRTLPDPFMESLDCPAGDTITPARDNSVTVQQALALWNDAIVARRSEQFAARVRDLASSTTEQVGVAFSIALGRTPTREEAAELEAYNQKYGLENLCRVILNLNEFVFVN